MFELRSRLWVVAVLIGIFTAPCFATQDSSAISLQALEELYSREKNPDRRLGLLYRWIEFKKEDSEAIVERLGQELGSDRWPENLKQELHRQLAYKLLELKLARESAREFEKIQSRSSKDELAYGDALLLAGLAELAYQAYSRAPDSAEAYYKRAWSQVNRQKFSEALADFDKVLSLNDGYTKEAYRDRILPWIEVNSGYEFSESTSEKFADLAKSITESEQAGLELFYGALELLVERLSQKGEVRMAEKVYENLSKRRGDAREKFSPQLGRWLKAYRVQLDHASVERLLLSLPSEAQDISQAKELAIELFETAKTYDRLSQSSKDLSADKIAKLASRKFIILFPDDERTRALRPSLLAALYEEFPSGESAKTFAAELETALLRIPSHMDGSSSEPLSRLLLGALKKSPQNSALRSLLSQWMDQYPYEKTSIIFKDLRVADAEIRFRELQEASDLSAEEKARSFESIWRAAPANSSVALLARENALVLSGDDTRLKECESFLRDHPKEFTPEKAIFISCFQVAEQGGRLDLALQFLTANEGQLNDKQKIQLGFLELANQQNERGRSRLIHLGAQQAYSLWMGAEPASEFAKLKRRLDEFYNQNKATKGESTVKQAVQLDKALVAYFKNQASPKEKSQVLWERSRLMAWLSNEFKEEPALALQASERKMECGQQAYVLDLERNEDSTFCPEATPTQLLADRFREWKFSIPEEARNEDAYTLGLLEASERSSGDSAKYLAFRSYESLKSRRAQARALFRLWQVTHQFDYLENALRTDPSMSEAESAFRAATAGNPAARKFLEPFFSRQVADAF